MLTHLRITLRAPTLNRVSGGSRGAGAALRLSANLASSSLPHVVVPMPIPSKGVSNLVENHVVNLFLGQQHCVVLGQSNLLCKDRTAIDTDVVSGTEPTLTAVELKPQTAHTVRSHECLCLLLNLVKFHA